MVERSAYRRLFIEGWAYAKKFGYGPLGIDREQVSEKSIFNQAAHEYVALNITSKKGIDKYEGARKALQRCYDRKVHGQKVPKSWMGLDKQDEIKGEWGWIPREMLVRNPEGYYSGAGA